MQLTVNVGITLLVQLQKAVIMYTKHREAFEKFTDTFPPDVISKWDQMVKDWDADNSKPNPYQEPAAGKYTFPLLRTPFFLVKCQEQPRQMSD